MFDFNLYLGHLIKNAIDLNQELLEEKIHANLLGPESGLLYTRKKVCRNS